MRIFIVDDEPRQRRGMEQLIQGLRPDAEVLSFPNGLLALERMLESPPDIVFSDIRMPHVSGLELAEKAHEIRADIIIVLISAYAEFEYAQKAISLGVAEFLVKPIQPAAVGEVLRRIAERVHNAKNARLSEGAAGFGEALRQAEQTWRALLSNPDAVSAAAIRQIAPPKNRGRYVRLLVNPARFYSSVDLSEAQENLMYWFNAAIPLCSHCARRIGPVLVIYAMTSEAEPDAQKLEQVRVSMYKDYDLTVSLLLSRYTETLSEGYLEALAELDRMESMLFYHDSGAVMLAEYGPPPNWTLHLCGSEDYQRLTQSVLAWDADRAIEYGKAILHTFQSKNILPEQIKESVIHCH